MARDGQLQQPAADADKPGRGLFGSVKFYGGIGAVGLLGIFFAQNMQDVELNILWMSWTTPMFFALVLAAALGAVAAWFFSTMRGRARRKMEAARARDKKK
jgi:uncharacterized integral membrane protein